MTAQRGVVDVAPLGVDPDATDAVLLGAVVQHYAERLSVDPDRANLLSVVGASEQVAGELAIGFSDRTLGLRVPNRQLKAGAALRSRLISLGIYRESGHETFRGCVVVPVVSADGEIVGLFGRRIDRGKGDLWANGLPGGVFNPGALGSARLLVATSIPESLAVLSAGHEAVVAPGRAKGFTKADCEAICASNEVVVAGLHADRLAGRLKDLGANVGVLAGGCSLIELLGGANDAQEALGALVDEARVSSAPPSDLPPPGPPKPQASAGERPDEVFVHTATHSWRIRGAAARGNREGDLLRVALSVTDTLSGRFHLDTLDLYAARQRGAFLKAAGTELQIDPHSLSGELAEVIHAAEVARDEVEKPEGPPAMTEVERDEALSWLGAPDLLDQVGNDLAALGVVGERTNLLITYLGTISRLAERPLGVVVQSSSAAGKSTLTDAVCTLVPDEDLIAVSALTGQSLYYLSSGSLAHKVLSVAEEAGATRASYALKLLVSEGRLAIVATGKDRATGKLRTASYETAGPVALVLTTTATEVDPELENRLVVLGVDESAEQTRAIVAAQRAAMSEAGLFAHERREAIRRRHRNAQRLLRPYRVVIPEFEATFESRTTRHRRDHQKLLSLIAAVTLLHQHQRDVRTRSEGSVSVSYLVATPADVETALALGGQVLWRRNEDLAPQTARLFSEFVALVNERAEDLGCSATEVPVTRRELRERLGWSHVQVRKATDRLVALEYLVASGGGRGRCRTYHYVADLGTDIPQVVPDGPAGGPTSHLPRAGKTPGLVQLVPLSESPIPSRSHVGTDTKSKSR